MRVSKHDYVTAFDLEEIGRREIAMEHFDVVAIQDAAFGVIEFEIKEALIDAGIAVAALPYLAAQSIKRSSDHFELAGIVHGLIMALLVFTAF